MSEGKKCPYCAENIDANANKCEFCNEAITGTTASSKDPQKWFLSLDIKSKAIVAFAGLLAGVFLIMLFCGGEPCLDVSSQKAYEESVEDIIEYLAPEVKELQKKYKDNNLTESDTKKLAAYAKLKIFLDTPHLWGDGIKDDVHGMPVSELLEYVMYEVK